MTSTTQIFSEALTTEQRKTVVTIWSTYALFYIGRLNLSPALPTLAIALGVSRAEVGLLGTVFFWAYAFGHLVNGELGNHFSPHKIVSLGLLVIAVANILFSFQTSLLIMLILWGINGLAQSTGWGPMLRILSERLNEPQRKRIATLFPMSFLFGTAITWTFAGWLVAISGWNIAFFVPGVILLGVCANWWFSGIDVPAPENKSHHRLNWLTIQNELVDFRFLLIIAFFLGFIQTGANIWIPTYVVDTRLFPATITGLIAGVVPIFGIIGMHFTGALLRRTGDPLRAMIILLSISSLSFFLSAITTLPLQLPFLVTALMLSSGAGAIILSAVPMMLAKEGRASSVAGSITALANFGAGAAGVGIGAVVETFNWSHAFGLWMICCLVGILFARLDMNRRNIMRATDI